ncbi:C-type lectin domain family 17, member A-like [Alligator mississippiensis]|uniref:C-type lectin domain family 17, member A-like n=1 Tax=Alligator mississippiensis TaxID=8496 RepID=UPI002877467E|nr:C-type lectin domain family 17, member A-like [Alligator mississippiensis]
MQTWGIQSCWLGKAPGAGQRPRPETTAAHLLRASGVPLFLCLLWIQMSAFATWPGCPRQPPPSSRRYKGFCILQRLSSILRAVGKSQDTNSEKMGTIACISLCLLGCLTLHQSSASESQLHSELDPVAKETSRVGSPEPLAHQVASSSPSGELGIGPEEIALLAAPGVGENRGKKCGRGWLHYQGSCYGYFSQPKRWEDAEITCQSYGHRVHLVSLHNIGENSMIARYISQHHGRNGCIWIGLYDRQHRRSWRWADESLVNYLSWDEWQPDNVRNIEYCAASCSNTGFQRWHDYPCEEHFSFLCKHRL